MNNLQWTIEWIATDQWDDEVVLAEIAVAALREVEASRKQDSNLTRREIPEHITVMRDALDAHLAKLFPEEQK